MNQEQVKSDYYLRSKTKEDYISKLPYDVLERILKIHPIDSASKAVAILTRYFYRHSIKYDQDATYDFVYEILRHFANFDKNNPLKKLRRLEYHFSQGFILIAQIGLDKKQLDLDFSVENQKYSEIVFNKTNVARIPPHLLYVNTLKLTSINYLSNKFVSSIISKFPFVKCLIIDKSKGLRYLRVENLDKLTSLYVLDCVDLKLVYVDVLELKSLRFHGNLCWFSFKNVTHLEDVKLDSKGPRFDHLNHRLFNPLLSAIQDVKVLTLHGWMFKEVFGPLLFTKYNEKHFRFRRLRELWWIDTSTDYNNMNSLICFLKFCTSLKRLFVTTDPQSFSSPNQYVCDNQKSIKIKKRQLRDLKVVILQGVTDEKACMFFKEKIREIFCVEPLMLEVRPGMFTRCLIRTTTRETLDNSRDLKFSYKFVEETDRDIKHPHMT